MSATENKRKLAIVTMHDESTRKQVRMFRVGLNVRTGIYFPKDETLTLTNFPSEIGPLEMVFGVDRRVPEGFADPIRVGLWIDVTGPAESLEQAIEVFGNVARGITAFIGLAANTECAEPTAVTAIEVTAGAETRDYWYRETEGLLWPKGFGRGLLSQAPKAAIEAWNQQLDDERERLFRGIVQYHHAIQNWDSGSEIAALAHIWIGMEAITKVARTRHTNGLVRLADDRISARLWDGPSQKFGDPETFRNYNDLDGVIRQRFLFQDDDDIYKAAKKASDAYEHSFEPLWKVRELAIAALEDAAKYLRQALFELLGLDSTFKKIYLNQVFASPYSESADLTLRGKLTGTPLQIVELEGYPEIWMDQEPFQIGKDEEGDAAIGYRARIVAQGLPDGVAFEPANLSVSVSESMAENTGLKTGRSESDLDDAELTHWQVSSADGSKRYAQALENVFEARIDTQSSHGHSFDGSSEYRVETTQSESDVVAPEDLLRSAKRVQSELMLEDWEPICAFPAADRRWVSVVYRRRAPSGRS